VSHNHVFVFMVVTFLIGLVGALRTAGNAVLAQESKYVWTKVRDTTLDDNYGQRKSTGLGPIWKAMYQGFAGEPTFSDDSRYLFVTTMEGDTGVMKVDLRTARNPLLTGYTVNNQVYNNLLAGDQQGDVVVYSSSTGAATAQALDAATMDTLPGWPIALDDYSVACRTDGTWAFITLNRNPGRLLCVKIASPATRLTLDVADDWDRNRVYSLELDPPNKRLLAISNSGKAHLVDYSPLYGPRPERPILLSTAFGTQHVGVPCGNRVYLANGTLVQTYDLTAPASPRVVPAGSFTNPRAAAPFDKMRMDRGRRLLYLPYGGHGTPSAVLVLSINASTGALSAVPGGNFAGNTQGSVTLPCDACGLSRDGTRLAISTGFQGGGGTRVWDVSALASGGRPAILTDIYSNQETRGALMVHGDTAPYIYDFSRYGAQVADASDTLIAMAVDGLIHGNLAFPIGVTSGTDPHGARGPTTTADHILVYGGGFYDGIYHCAGGKATWVQSLGDAAIVAAYWSGKYLYLVPNNVGHNGRPGLYVYAITWSQGKWTLSLRASWVSSKFTAFNGAAVYVDGGEWGTPSAVGYVVAGLNQGYPNVDSTGQGVFLIDLSHGGINGLQELTSGSLPDQVIYQPPAPSTATLQAGGQLAQPYTYWFSVAYYTDHGTLVGITPLGARAYVFKPGHQIVLSGFPVPPPGAATMTIGSTTAYGNAQTPQAGPAPVPEAVRLPVSNKTVTIRSAKEKWFGGLPSPGDAFPSAGGILQIVKAAGRIYVTWGDHGIRVYDAVTHQFRGAITATGDPNPQNNPLASSCLAVSKQGGKTWLVSNNYTASGGHGGLVLFDLSANPDNPPPTFIPTCAAGFTVWSDDTLGPSNAGIVFLNTLSGPVGYQLQAVK
jgi:hypothetical protein